MEIVGKTPQGLKIALLTEAEVKHVQEKDALDRLQNRMESIRKLAQPEVSVDLPEAKTRKKTGRCRKAKAEKAAPVPKSSIKIPKPATLKEAVMQILIAANKPLSCLDITACLKDRGIKIKAKKPETAIGVMMALGWVYWLGLAAVAGLLVYEHSLVSPTDLSRVNLAFFNINGYIAIIIFVATLGGLYVG